MNDATFTNTASSSFTMDDLKREIERLSKLPPVVVRFECNANAYGAIKDHIPTQMVELVDPMALATLIGIRVVVSDDIPLDGKRVNAIYSDGHVERMTL